MKLLKTIDNILAKVESALLILILMTMILMAFTQVLMRNFFQTSIIWGDTFLRHLVLWVGFIGASLATRENRHINIDVLSRILSPKIKRVTDSVVNLFAAVVCFFLMKAGITFIKYEIESESTLFAGIPTWIFQIIIVIGFALIMFRFFIKTIERIMGKPAVQPEERAV